MGLNEIVSAVQDFIQTSPEGAAAAAVLLVILLWRKPKIFLVLVSLAIAVVGIMIVLDNLSSTGIADRKFDSLTDLK